MALGKSVSIANCSSFNDLDRLCMPDMAAITHMCFEERPWQIALAGFPHLVNFSGMWSEYRLI